MKKNQHEIIIMGGVGNQLFLMAQALRLQLLYPNDEIILNHGEYLLGLRSDRPYYLDDLFKNLRFKKLRRVDAIFSYLLIRLFLKIAKKKLTITGDSCNIFGRKIYFGYFQHIDAYFSDEQILSLLRSECAKAVTSKYQGDVLAVHVRRGDYLLPQHGQHGLIQINDLLEEVRVAFAVKSYKQILVFSDSPDLINMSSFEQFGVPVSLDGGGDVIAVFKRMMQCDGLIASNSSFSLWAGLLGQPDFFSIPEMWMPNMPSTLLGLSKVRRYRNQF